MKRARWQKENRARRARVVLVRARACERWGRGWVWEDGYMNPYVRTYEVSRMIDEGIKSEG